MKNAFQNIPVGQLPIDWDIRRLKDVADFSNGKGHEKVIDENGDYIVVNSKFVSTEGEVKKHSKENLCPLVKEDIVMVMSDIPNGKAIAKCFLIDKDNRYTLNQRICSIKAKESIDTKYLFYVLNRNKYYLAFDNGVSQTNLRKDEVLDCPIQVPKYPEQQKIAEILSTVDAKIEVIDQQITETQELKKGLMQRLLTKGIGHTEFKDSVLGEIPTSWEVVRSSDVFELVHGYQFRDYDFTEVGLPIVKIGQINRRGEIDMTGCSFFSTDRAEEFADKRIYNGDVLMALTGATLGKSCWVSGLEFPVYQNYRVGKFVPHDENVLSKQFLYFLVGSPLALNQIMSKINSGAQGNVGKSDFEKLKITLPPIEEQNKISTILSSVDEKLRVLSEKKINYQELKKGLMQQLLTGKVRVKTE